MCVDIMRYTAVTHVLINIGRETDWLIKSVDTRLSRVIKLHQYFSMCWQMWSSPWSDRFVSTENLIHYDANFVINGSTGCRQWPQILHYRISWLSVPCPVKSDTRFKVRKVLNSNREGICSNVLPLLNNANIFPKITTKHGNVSTLLTVFPLVSTDPLLMHRLTDMRECNYCNIPRP